MTVTPWYRGSANDEYNYFTKNEARYFFKILPFTKGFGGNSVKSWLNYEQVLNCKIDYITFLRNPIERYISHHNQYKNEKKTYWDIKQYLRQREFDNLMTKRIAGSADLNKAKKILLEDFTFVGLTERFDESLISRMAT